jgi:hypothetical protein
MGLINTKLTKLNHFNILLHSTHEMRYTEITTEFVGRMAIAVTQEMLEQAQSAYHRLMIGDAVVEFRDQNGETVKYARADLNRLSQYIERLKVELGLSTASVAPMRVWL